MKRVICLLLVLLMVCGTAAAANGGPTYDAPTDFEGMTLEQVMDEFMEENGLNESNFCISYYNTVTGESYAFNDEKFSIAASTYKLPLNMYFYEMQRDGEIDGDAPFRYTGLTLNQVHEQSIVNSNNELSEAMMYYWGDHKTYKDNMRKYFTMTDEEIDPSYYNGNYYCVRMMMDCLHYLYDNSDDFEELLGYMKIAKPGEHFKRFIDEYEVAHKYGSVQVFENDVGIIYAPQPILLAVYTQGIYGEVLCGKAARLLTNYTVWQEEHSEPEPEMMELEEAEVVPEEVSTTSEEPVEELPAEQPEEQPVEELSAEAPAPVPAPQAPQTPPAPAKPELSSWMMAGLACVAAGGVLLVVVAVQVLKNKKKKTPFKDDTEED